MKRFSLLALAGALALGAALSGVAANDAQAAQVEPDPAANPVLASIMKLGTKIYYMGARGGLDGWMIYKNGQIQIAYAIPGGQDIVVGAMFGASGENVSSAQVQSILDDHPDIKNALMSSADKPSVTQIDQGGGPNDPMATIAAATAAAKAEIARQAAALPGAGALPPGLAALPLPQGTASATGASSDLSPGERLMSDLQKAAGVKVGSASAPQLLMVMDPTCPHCQKTWQMLRDKVFGNLLQVRLVPIARDANNFDQERIAAQLLRSTDTLQVWDKFESGDKSQLAGDADASLIQAVRANHRLIDSWHIDHTPFLVYRGKDGKVKIVQGEPDKPDALFADLLP